MSVLKAKQNGEWIKVGCTGPAGASAYDVAVKNGFEGTEDEWLLSLIGPDGAQGEPGEDGGYYYPVTSSVDGNIMQIEWNASKTSMVGLPPSLITLPAGKSAYEYAVDGGYEGTEEEFAELMANGNGPQNGNGGTSVQADLAQNDETASDYVKNRTHYEEVGLVELCSKEDGEFTFNEDASLYMSEFIAMNFQFDDSKDYIVNWDGTEYVCTPMDVYNGLFYYIGNPSLLGGEDTGEPFGVQIVLSQNMLGFVTKDSSATHTFSLSTKDVVVHTIDEKFIPNSIARTKDIPGNNVEQLVFEKTLSFTSGSIETTPIYYESPFVGITDEMIIVYWDDIRYECTTYFYSDIDGENVCFGNIKSIVNDYEEETDFPFSVQAGNHDNSLMFIRLVTAPETDETHSIRIYRDIPNVIDLKYLPDTIATKEYVDDSIANIDTGGNNTTNITVNGVKPDENGNIQIEVGSEQVQSDWNQSDENAVDYVKNRPLYRAADEEVPFYEKEFTINAGDSSYTDYYNTPFASVNDEKYVVIWDGTRYECNNISTSSYYVRLGNYNFEDSDAEDTGEPFYISGSTTSGNDIRISAGSNSETDQLHTIQICRLFPNYQVEDTLAIFLQGDWNESDETTVGYIKNRPFYDEKVTVDFLTSTRITYTQQTAGYYQSDFIPVSYRPIIGENYNFRYNNVTNTTKCQATYYLGNMHITYPTWFEDTGENFLIVFDTIDNIAGIYIIVSTLPTNYYSWLSGPAIITHTIDKKYLPDGIVREADWNENNETASGYIKNRTHWSDNGVLLTEEPITLDFGELTDNGNMHVDCNDIPNFTNGMTYTVYWNKKRYEVQCVHITWENPDIQTYGTVKGYDNYLGNLDLGGTIGGEPDNNYPDLPFLIHQGVFDTTGVTSLSNTDVKGIYMQGTVPSSVTLEIYEGTHSYHTLDERFIPDTIATVEYVDKQIANVSGGVSTADSFILNSSTEGSTKQFKITIDDTGTLTVAEISEE